MSKPLKIFITYSHMDRDAKNELRKRLVVMEEHERKIKIWHDNEILPGDKWYQEISTNLTGSDILLYLVSAQSLASKNCNKELADAMNFDISVIPIILEDCDWQKHQLGNFQVLPENGRPINEWQRESQAWQNVVSGIRRVVDMMQSQTLPSTLPDTPQQPPPPLPSVQQAELMQQQGNFLGMIGQMDKAIEAYSKAIELNPAYAGAYNNRGIAYDETGKSAPAIADFNKAIELKPDFAEAYNNRGTIYSNQGNSTRAITDFNKAIVLKPDFAGAYMNRGIAYFNKGESTPAIADFNKAIALDPNYAEAYMNRGTAYSKTGESVRAFADFDKAIELKPDFAEAYMNRGDTYIRNKGEFAPAFADFNKAIELNPKLTGTYMHRGAAYSVKGENDRAIEDYTKAIALNPDYTKAYTNRGKAWLHLKKWENARSDLEVARERGVDIKAAFQNDFESAADFEQKNGIKLPPDIAAMLTRMPVHSKVFISYSHDSPAHKQWVLELGVKLRHNGVDVVLDQWDLNPGGDMTRFMDVGFENSERVLVICTDNYVKRANNGKGGVGYERLIITAELVEDLGTSKFIPIIRQASGKEKVPKFLKTRVHIDFTDDRKFNEKFTELLHELHQVEQKPPLGKNPFAQPDPTSRQTVTEIPQTKEEQAQTNRNAEQGQQQERLKNAIDHLGHASETVRMGGAHELFHLAKDNPELRPTVMDILCFHIRNTTKKEEYRKTHQSKPSEEVQSLLTLLFVQDHDVFKGLLINLQESWLNGANLQKARLQKAILKQASLRGARLDMAHLQEANLVEAHLEEAVLEQVNLQGAKLISAYLQGGTLFQARLQRANLWMARLHAAYLHDVHLQGANLADVKLQGAILLEARLQGTNLSRAYLTGAILDNANLQGAGTQDWSSSTHFAERIKKLIGKESDLSTVLSGGIDQKVADALEEGLSDEKAKILRESLRPHIDKPFCRGLPANSGANTRAFTEEEAKEWIAEYEEAMSEVPTDKE